MDECVVSQGNELAHIVFRCQVETISDTYMVISGVPDRNGARHIIEQAKLSLDLVNEATNFKVKHRKESLQLRIGR